MYLDQFIWSNHNIYSKKMKNKFFKSYLHYVHFLSTTKGNLLSYGVYQKRLKGAYCEKGTM